MNNNNVQIILDEIRQTLTGVARVIPMTFRRKRGRLGEWEIRSYNYTIEVLETDDATELRANGEVFLIPDELRLAEKITMLSDFLYRHLAHQPQQAPRTTLDRLLADDQEVAP